MTDKEMKSKAREFVKSWNGKGYEKGETQRFWIDLLDRVFGVPNASNYIEFEKPIKLESGKQGFIDGYIPSVKVLIEQKGSHVDPRKPEKQSDGTFQTPYQQARRYENQILQNEQPHWIIVCNFSEFIIYDMRVDKTKPVCEFTLDNLPNEIANLQFLVDTNVKKVITEVEISVAAGALVSEMYDALLEQYSDPTAPETLHSLNVLCVRLVFCFYAENAGVFKANSFGRYLDKYRKEPQNMRKVLIEVFRTLDTPYNERDPYDDKELLDFPYVNGGLFDKNLKITIPAFNEKIAEIIIDKASFGFNWSAISPTIFGAVFESTLNPETRRSGGMHYTSIENIHKVIDPLFLDDLKAELKEIEEAKQVNIRKTKLEAFRDKIAGLKFLDPACGSGNFLTETYLSLRRLENEVLNLINNDQILLDTGEIIKVSIGQFYGIEINDFAVTVAKTALWIAESQMLRETEEIIKADLNFLPLKSYANIIEGNALRVDWNTVVPKNELNYIMGNPPFVGHQMRNDVQVNDMQVAFYDLEKHGKLDYVCAWYNKAADYMKDTEITTAFVSTNSIIQGESVGILWKFLFENKKVEIQFAYQTFIWDSEANMKAHVHCVVVGFSCNSNSNLKKLFVDNTLKLVPHINGYLISAPDVFIQSRGNPLTIGMPKMSKGSQPTDGGNLILTEEEKEMLINKYPETKEFIRRYISADDYINNKMRYCLWLDGVSPKKYRDISFISKRLEQVAEFRKNSPTKSVQEDASTPMIFTQIRQPSTTYLAMPEVSSSKRMYIPFGYIEPDVISSNMLYLIPDVSLFIFGVMTSNVHMSWARIFCGRLKSDYRYTPAVYNNFPWCNPTEEQKAKIEQTAQAILDTRAKYPDCSLADLYDETTMPPDLRKAHKANDQAVLAAYGFPKDISESEIVAELMKMYQELTEK